MVPIPLKCARALHQNCAKNQQYRAKFPLQFLGHSDLYTVYISSHEPAHFLKIRKFFLQWCFVLVIHCLTSIFHTDDVSVGGGDMPTGLLLTATFGREAPFIIQGSSDQMAQEGDEVFTIPLSVTSQNLPAPVFVAGPASVTVIDNIGEYSQSCPLYVHVYRLLQILE